ncbi:MAG: class I SAM-dependent methyltransferase [Methanomassiliicoccales archaeon]|nr:class I SAM-dependent methyltransferase [Methanomassiliicoccales archaeon]
MAPLFGPKKRKAFDYKSYWENRYRVGDNSGSGSYELLAEYKAEVLNEFVKKKDVDRVIEFGCGDGNQLSLYKFNTYLGLDVSEKSIELNMERYSDDYTKSFMLYDPDHFANGGFLKADLVICIDVLYHITDESDFKKTLRDIFDSSSKYVALYTNTKIFEGGRTSNHIKYRDIFPYLSSFSEFSIDSVLENPHADKSSANFIFLSKSRKGVLIERAPVVAGQDR